jgi:hypothetical protein
MRDFSRPVCIAAGLLLLAVVARSTAVQGPLFENAPASVFVYETLPGDMPSTDTTVIAKDLWVTEITLANDTGSTDTCAVYDKQGTPKIIIPHVSLPAHTIYVINFQARYAPGGVSWSCTTGTGVTGTLRGKRLGI